MQRVSSAAGGPPSGAQPPGLNLLPPPRPPYPGAQRELGAVAVLREKYGFIKCVSRSADLFFHVTELRGPAGWTPVAGDDVEFWSQQDSRSAKLVATDVRPAPRGAAVFERVAAERLRGICLERLPAARAPGGARGDDGQLAQPSGLIEVMLPPPPAPASGSEEQQQPPERLLLPFTRADLAAGSLPRPADCVELSLLTDVRTGSQRATAVALLPQTGAVVAVKPTFGFIEPAGGDAAGGRIFYHASEVEGGGPLAPRDTVEFLLCHNNKTGERNARRVRLLQSGATAREEAEAAEAARLAALRERHAASGGGGALAARTPVRIVEGPPDGATRGFGLGRGAARLAYGTQGGLRPGAAEWLPTPVDAARLASADEAGAFQPAVASVPSG
jgi:cold shock CspA family protein